MEKHAIKHDVARDIVTSCGNINVANCDRYSHICGNINALETVVDTTVT